MTTTLLFTVGFWLSTTVVGMAVLHRLFGVSRVAPLELALLGFGVGALILFFSVWATGSFAYTAQSMWMVSAGWGLLALVSIPYLKGARVLNLRDLAIELGAARELFWIAMLIALSIFALLSGLASPADFDGLNYHLTMPRRDLEAGRILAVVNDRPMEAFPAFMEMLYRLALATAGDRAAQNVHGVFAIVAALSACCLARRLHAGGAALPLAGVMFLGIRTVVWESGTTHNELGLAAYCGLALIAFFHWRENQGIGAAVLLGLMLGSLSNVKYQGLVLAACFGPPIAYELLFRHRRFQETAIVVAVAGLVFLPWALRNAVVYGNPVAPLLAPMFPNSDPAMHIAFSIKGEGLWSSVLGALRSPWDIFVFPTKRFDGQQFGAPYLLIFAPLAAAAWKRLHTPWPAVLVGIGYYVIWYFLLFRQIRFLIPIFPILAAYGAVGAVVFWAEMKKYRATLAMAASITLILFANQLMFVGAYAALRLPSAIGLVTDEEYLSTSPTLGRNMYRSCKFVSKTLRPDERYISFLNAPRSYYCPQKSAIYDQFDDERAIWARRARPFPSVDRRELLDRLKSENVRLVIMPIQAYSGLQAGEASVAVPFDLKTQRLGAAMADVLRDLTPAFEGRDAKVYWVDDIRLSLQSRN